LQTLCGTRKGTNEVLIRTDQINYPYVFWDLTFKFQRTRYVKRKYYLNRRR